LVSENPISDSVFASASKKGMSVVEDAIIFLEGIIIEFLTSCKSKTTKCNVVFRK